jgi:hypothetical protein
MHNGFKSENIGKHGGTKFIPLLFCDKLLRCERWVEV